jgi:hypothetical protein
MDSKHPQTKGKFVNIKMMVFCVILAVLAGLPLLGLNTHGTMTLADMKKHDMLAMMGVPMVDTAIDGLHVKIWLVTQEQHRKMMDEMMVDTMAENDMNKMNHDSIGMNDVMAGTDGKMKVMNHDGMGMDTATKGAMMTGTHHMAVDVTDYADGKEIAGATLRLLILSPSRKNTSVDLMPMMNCFGGGLLLEEKGKYRMTLAVSIDGTAKMEEFQYVVR